MSTKILLVDDSPLITTMIKSILESKGMQVRVASNGIEAICSLYEESPDVILLDIMLPDILGYMICRIIKEDQRLKQIPVVLLTGQEDKTTKFWSMEAGADFYISKGNCKPDQLLETLGKVLQKYPPQSKEDYKYQAEEIITHISNLFFLRMEELAVYRHFSKLFQMEDISFLLPSLFDLYSSFLDYTAGAFFLPKEKILYQYAPLPSPPSFFNAMKTHLLKGIQEAEKKTIKTIELDSFFHLKQYHIAKEEKSPNADTKIKLDIPKDLKSFFYYPLYKNEEKIAVLMLGSFQENLLEERAVSLFQTSVPILKSLLVNKF